LVDEVQVNPRRGARVDPNLYLRSASLGWVEKLRGLEPLFGLGGDGVVSQWLAYGGQQLGGLDQAADHH
jgi:hypothetical protein